MVIIGPLINAEEGLVRKVENLPMKINNVQMNAGVLYVTENYLRWQENGREEGISIPWQNISLHAISNAPIKCIYIMLDLRVDYPSIANIGNGNGNGNEEDDDDRDEGTCEDEEPEMTEIWFVPQNPENADHIFNAMKHCQSLHPDSDDSFSDEEDEFIMADNDEDGGDGDEDNHGVGGPGNEIGQGDMQNLHINDDERFADAQE